MSSHEKLSAAANDRKSRLAQLKSLKRKQAPSTEDSENDADSTPSSTALTTVSQDQDLSQDEPTTITPTYLSGRNFDPSTRTLKLGYAAPPIGDPTATLEYKAAQLALETKQAQDAEKQDADKGLDLFKLQPKRPNWDLKRDLEQKLRTSGLDARTENAIARAVRERIGGAKAGKIEQGRGKAVENGEEGEEVGMEGSELVEAMHLKERDEERERRREDEDEDGS